MISAGKQFLAFILACCLLPAGMVRALEPKGATQLESGTYGNVRETGQWEIIVPGRIQVGLGLKGLPWRFCFYHPRTGEEMESFLAANAFPVTQEMESFQTDWLGTAQYMEQCAHSYFGDLLTYISFDKVLAGPDGEVYVMFLELQNEGRRMEATVCYRFQHSYYAVYLGVNMGDMPEMFLLTKRAAGLFQDETAKPFSADSQMSYQDDIQDGSAWGLPVFNVLACLQDYTGGAFAYHEEPNEEPKTPGPPEDDSTGSQNLYTRTQRLLRNRDAVGDNIRPSPFRQDEGVYLIGSADDLNLLGEMIAEQVTFEDGTRAQFASYRLENDLDLSEYRQSGWTPIGQMVWGGIAVEEQYLAFSGNFDGNGKTITGLTVQKSEKLMFYGLFGYATFAEIHDLNILDCDVNGGCSTGAVAGGGFSTWSGDELIIRNCYVTGKVTGEGGTGGVAGVATTVENCGFEGVVKSAPGDAGADKMTGGVVGSSLNVKGCRANAIVQGNGMVGGVTGLTDQVDGSCFFGSVTGFTEVGGVAGYAKQVTGSYCAGSVSGYSTMGGLAGNATNLIAHSIMAGPFMKWRNPGREPGNIGRVSGSISTGADAIFSRKDLKLVGNHFTGHYPLDGESIEADSLLLPETWEALRTGDDTVDSLWQPLQAGCYPQLTWETGDPVRISKK